MGQPVLTERMEMVKKMGLWLREIAPAAGIRITEPRIILFFHYTLNIQGKRRSQERVPEHLRSHPRAQGHLRRRRRQGLRAAEARPVSAELSTG